MSSAGNHSNGARKQGLPLGGPATWLGLIIVGVSGWASFAILYNPAHAMRALLVNFIFFAPMAAAMVAWPAIVMVSRGTWLGSARFAGFSGIYAAPVAIAALVILWAQSDEWAVWLKHGGLPNAAWLDRTFLFTRDMVALVAWWAISGYFVFAAWRKKPKVLAGWTVFTYAIVFSLLAFDLVMALQPHWYSALFGAYFFISGLYAAIAAITFVTTQDASQPAERLHDLGKLIVTFSIMTTYLMFSQLLPQWYENLPNESIFLIPRMNYRPWNIISVALLILIYLGPLIFLLSVRAKKTAGYLGTMALVILCGLWVERWWLVAPAVGHARLGLDDAFAGAAFLGAIGLGVNRFVKEEARQVEGE